MASLREMGIGQALLSLPRIALGLYLCFNAMVGPIWLSLSYWDGTTTKGLSDPGWFYWAWLGLMAVTFVSCGLAGACLIFWTAAGKRGFAVAVGLLALWPLIIGLTFRSDAFWATLGKLMFITHLWILQVFNVLLQRLLVG